MQLKDPNGGTVAFSDHSGASLAARILGSAADALMPSQWHSERLTDEQVEARSLAFGVVRQAAFDLQEALDRRTGIRTSWDGNSFPASDLPELLSWIFDEDSFFYATLPLKARRDNPDRRDLTWHVELPDNGPFTFSNCCRLLRLDVVACRTSIQNWLDQRNRGIYTESLITAEGSAATVHQRRARQAERWRTQGMPEQAIAIVLTRKDAQPKPTGRIRRWRKKPSSSSPDVICLEPFTNGTADGPSSEGPPVPPIEHGPINLFVTGCEVVT
jgi:hypothetical protein